MVGLKPFKASACDFLILQTKTISHLDAMVINELHFLNSFGEGCWVESFMLLCTLKACLQNLLITICQLLCCKHLWSFAGSGWEWGQKGSLLPSQVLQDKPGRGLSANVGKASPVRLGLETACAGSLVPPRPSEVKTFKTDFLSACNELCSLNSFSFSISDSFSNVPF